MESHPNQTITITFCDRAENHVGMQQLGELSDCGFSYENLMEAKNWFDDKGEETHLYDLSWPLEKSDLESSEAYILVAKAGVNAAVDPDKLFTELVSLKWDTKAFMYGRVVNKNARYNLCFGDFNQKPDYSAGKGSVYSFNKLPMLNKLRKILCEILELTNIVAEGNYYHDVNKCGIGFHGDAERRQVIGVRLGASIPIEYQWFYQSKPVGSRISIMLDHGDIYIMSEKTVGTDWKKKNIPTLRHAAGSEKYLTI